MGRAWFSSFSIAGKKSIMVHRFRTSWLCCLCYADPPIGCFHIIGSVPDAARSFSQVSTCPWLSKLRVRYVVMVVVTYLTAKEGSLFQVVIPAELPVAPWHPIHSPNKLGEPVTGRGLVIFRYTFNVF